MNLVQLTVQFELQTKSPVASNSAGVMQVIQVKWNLCLHFLHLTQGVSSVSNTQTNDLQCLSTGTLTKYQLLH